MFYFVDEKTNSKGKLENGDKEDVKSRRKRSTLDTASGYQITTRKVQSVGIFPTFDRCDSLLYFPETFVSCVNSADFKSLAKLMKSRVNQHCELTMVRQKLNLTGFIKMFELMDELHPDQVMHVQTTKVIRNQVRAKLYFKFTESRALRNAIAKSTNAPSLLALCPAPQSLVSKVVKNMVHESDADKEEFIALVTTAEELVVYGCSQMTITFDAYSKHITHFELKCEVTSYGAVPKEK